MNIGTFMLFTTLACYLRQKLVIIIFMPDNADNHEIRFCGKYTARQRCENNFTNNFMLAVQSLQVMRKAWLLSMKKNMAKVVSSMVMSIAKKSSSTVCDWRTYQPKVPQKLLKK